MAIHPTTVALPESRTAGRAVQSHEVVNGEMAPHMDRKIGFDDVLEAVNPLNHIPGFSSSEALSSNPLMMPVRLVTNFLATGPIGLLTGMFNTVFSASGAGDDVAASLKSAFRDNGEGMLL